MSASRYRAPGGGALRLCRSCGLFRAAEAARDVARGVHGARRPRARPWRDSSGARLRGPSLHRDRRRRRRRLNMWWDADIDARMARTAQRPIPAGRVAPGEALAFGVVLAVASVAMLGLFAGWLAAGLLAFTIFFYAVLYTMGLKRLDRAEHRDRRCGRRVSADDRLGRGHGLDRARKRPFVPDDLLLDASAFLGARAFAQERICARGRADVAGRRGRG